MTVQSKATIKAAITASSAGALTGGTILSNMVDSYVDAATSGTWIPTDVSGAGLTLTNVASAYFQIDSLVIATSKLTYPVTADGTTASVGGLPFTINNGAPGRIFTLGLDDSSATAFITVPFPNGTRAIFFTLAPFPAAAAALKNSDFSGRTLDISVIYTKV